MPSDFDFTETVIGTLFEQVNNAFLVIASISTAADNNPLQKYFPGRTVAYYQQVRQTGTPTWDSDLDSWQFEKKTRK